MVRMESGGRKKCPVRSPAATASTLRSTSPRTRCHADGASRHIQLRYRSSKEYDYKRFYNSFRIYLFREGQM